MCDKLEKGIEKKDLKDVMADLKKRMSGSEKKECICFLKICNLAIISAIFFPHEDFFFFFFFKQVCLSFAPRKRK